MGALRRLLAKVGEVLRRPNGELGWGFTGHPGGNRRQRLKARIRRFIGGK